MDFRFVLNFNCGIHRDAVGDRTAMQARPVVLMAHALRSSSTTTVALQVNRHVYDSRCLPPSNDAALVLPPVWLAALALQCV